jgi:uncharacterized protein YjiS (DUF1127 family)
MNRLLETYEKWRLYRRTCRELSQLSTRDLSDLGIHRSQIPAIARQVFDN